MYWNSVSRFGIKLHYIKRFDAFSFHQVRGRDWADGTVDFKDGQDTAEVRIPLTKAPMPAVPRKRSFFWLHVVDQTSKKRMATMRVKLIDDKGLYVWC